MQFKNVIPYRLTGEFPLTSEQLEEKLAEQQFTPCGSQDLSRYGWVSPSNGLSDMLTHEAHGAILICAQKEEKIIPPKEVKRLVEEKAKLIEKEQARKVYRKERDQLKDEVVMDMLPRAFSRFSQVHALILPQHGWVIVDSATHKKAEELLSYLRGTLGTLPIQLPDVKHSPSAIMSQWVETSSPRPKGVEILDEAQMRDNLVEGGVITIKGQELVSDEFVAHLEAGKRVVKLAIEWEESIRFKLSEDLTLKQIKFTDQLKERMDQESNEDQLAQFDSDVALHSAEYARLIPLIVEAFGGFAEAP